MSLIAAKANILDSTKKLRAAWDRTRASWNDPASQALERDVLAILEPRVLAACKGVDELHELIHQARRECGEDDAPL